MLESEIECYRDMPPFSLIQLKWNTKFQLRNAQILILSPLSFTLHQKKLILYRFGRIWSWIWLNSIIFHVLIAIFWQTKNLFHELLFKSSFKAILNQSYCANNCVLENFPRLFSILRGFIVTKHKNDCCMSWIQLVLKMDHVSKFWIFYNYTTMLLFVSPFSFFHSVISRSMIFHMSLQLLFPS